MEYLAILSVGIALFAVAFAIYIRYQEKKEKKGH
jgi:mannose/fructose/N-acetylgalactosamine-specific phosphotransferase system component IIC